MFYKRISYTFKEIMQFIYDYNEYHDDTDLEPHSQDQSLNLLGNFMDGLNLSYNTNFYYVYRGTEATILNHLFLLLYNRHYKDYFYSVDVDFNEEHNLTIGELKECSPVNNLLSIIEKTAPRYFQLLYAYKQNADNPVAQIGATTSNTTRFNDTPQDGGDFADDDHTTNITQSESSTLADSGSIASKLNELFKNYRSIINDWLDEFNGIFFKEDEML